MDLTWQYRVRLQPAVPNLWCSFEAEGKRTAVGGHWCWVEETQRQVIVAAGNGRWQRMYDRGINFYVELLSVFWKIGNFLTPGFWQTGRLLPLNGTRNFTTPGKAALAHQLFKSMCVFSKPLAMHSTAMRR